MPKIKTPGITPLKPLKPMTPITPITPIPPINAGISALNFENKTGGIPVNNKNSPLINKSKSLIKTH